MPFPIAAAITAGASALSTGGQIYASGKMNKKTREWNEKMYGIQRQDALNDWNMMNQYNSPEAQMQRFKAAGLNPNLIYGQQNEGATVRSTDAKGWNPQVPDIQGGVSRSLSAFIDYTLQQEQVKNMQASRENMAADKLIKEVTAANLLTTGDAAKFDLSQRQRLADTIVDQANATLAQTKANTQVTLNQDERAALSNVQSLREGAERILNMRMDRAVSAEQIQQIRAQANQLRSSTLLNNLDAELKKQGIQPGDNLLIRILGRILNDADIDIPGIIGGKIKSLLEDKSVKGSIYTDPYYKKKFGF